MKVNTDLTDADCGCLPLDKLSFPNGTYSVTFSLLSVPRVPAAACAPACGRAVNRPAGGNHARESRPQCALCSTHGNESLSNGRWTGDKRCQ